MYKFKPILKTLIWGTESWVLSGVPGSESVVSEGPDKGRTLTDVYGPDFPLLIKFIDARRDLSIQVHPGEELAQKRHSCHGKTEMWYVIRAEKDARLISGFSRRIDPEQYEELVRRDEIVSVLASHSVKEGDVFFLPSGRVHAIGAGCCLAEIQQSSDITYRIYDYDRPGPDGRPRELHTELAKEAIDYTVPDDYRTHYERIRNKDTELVACPYFTTHLCDATFSVLCDYSALDSFVVLIFVAGAGELVDSEGNRVAVRQGETVLIPASTRQVTLLPGHGGLRFLSSYIETPEE